MNKNIHLIAILIVFLNTLSSAQVVNSVATINQNANGYYQTINLDAESACKCDEKTQRTYDLAKGLRPGEVVKYDLHAYQFKFGSSSIPVSKLFKAFENDLSVYKVSMKEWDSFMLLTTKEFNLASFEKAATVVFKEISEMTPEAFLKIKNIDSYNEYLQHLEEVKLKQQASPVKN